MPAIEPQYLSILKKILNDRFVPSLPPLTGNAKPADREAKQLSRAFSAFALHKILDISPQSAAKSVVDDFNDKGIDAIYYAAPIETLYLVQAKLKESEQFKQEDAHALSEGLRLLLKQKFNQFNANVQNRQVEIETALENCCHIKIVVAYTGDGVSQAAKDFIQSLVQDEDLEEERLDEEVIYYSPAEIIHDLRAENAFSSVNADIYLQKHQKISEPRVTYYGVASLTDLISLHEKHGKALYERNIRYFLGSGKSEINKSIQSTLLNSPESFFYLNNGITVVCDLIESKNTSKDNKKKFKIRGLSIVNGAQTVASAAEFSAQYPDSDISKAKVMLTMIHAGSEGGFGKQVTKARNHQNPVQISNFASLDDNQERLRQEIIHLGFSYQYRPEYQAHPDDKVIKLDEALRAIALLSNNTRFPVFLKSEFGRLTNPDSQEYQSIFDHQLTGTRLVNSVLCERSIRRKLVANEQRARGQERLIYRHGIYAISYVLMKRLKRLIGGASVLDSDDVDVILSQPLDQLRYEAYELARQSLLVGPLAFFRNQSSVSAFLVDLMEKNYSIQEPNEISAMKRTIFRNEAYSKQRLVDYMVHRAPQIEKK